MFRIIGLIIGYGFGLIQMAYIMGKLNGIDIREHGSGNSGSNNARRVLGKKVGGIVFAVDFSKALVAFWLTYHLFNNNPAINPTTAALYAGLGAILGHCFPFYLKFKGGKGIACSLAIILSIHFLMGLTIIAFGIGVLLISRYVSVPSITVNAVTPIFMIFYGFTIEPILISAIIAFICIYMHRSNIVRLLNGTEDRLFGKDYGKYDDDNEEETN